MTAFRGLIAYPVTPFDESGAVDHAELGRHLASLAVSGVDAVTVLGSSGSFAYLDADERSAVVRTAVRAVRDANPDLPVYAGVSAVATGELLENVADVVGAGVDGLLVSTVSYVPLTEDEVAHQCRRVAEASDLPICLYSNPGTTNFSFPLELVAQLSKEPTIRGLKESTPDAASFAQRHETLRSMVSGGFSHGLSGDALIADAGFAGDAWHSGPASVLPRHFAALRAAAEAGDAVQTAKLRDELAPLMHEFNGLRKLSNLYALARAAGIEAGEPRLPLLPIPGSNRRDLARLLEELGETL
ncbi:dihydrodipicolinate synthase family protein [Arthrobacter sp. KK5.5]|uniref:dihydrodipicolinate synthase family protein n=1 Tax=Arthrobacter sp. KK5.5 TaxID=3373084 RepID=UPI003EE6F19B